MGNQHIEKSNQGLKRKRTEVETSVEDTSRVPGKLHHGLKEARKAAKKVKTIEIRKLIKKIKKSRKEGKESIDISEQEAQLNILKNIDYEAFANTAMRTKIMKDKVLSQHQRVQEFISRELGDNLLAIPLDEGPTTKIYGRLLSSKLLANAIWLLCDDLRRLLGHEPKKPRQTTDIVHSPEISRTTNKFSLHKTTPTAGIHTDIEIGVETEDEQKNFIDEIGWESGSVDGNEQHDASGLDSGNNSEELKDARTSGDHRLIQSDDSVKSKLVAQSGITSTFLPSLSVGFVGGSVESDWSDTEAKFADPIQKKNRRGQRARRAIWEKKYGRNANHKKKEAESHKYRYYKNGDSQLRVKSKIEFGSLKPTASRPPTFMNDNDNSLHPSWEAKRKLKERQSVGITQPQGTKIRFSE